MKKDDNRILLDDLFDDNDVGQTIEIEFELTSDELKSFPSVLSIPELHVELTLDGASHYYLIHMEVYGTATLLDAHDLHSTLDYDFGSDMDITISPDDLDNSDLLPDPDGKFDLRGTILALLFDAIPRSYSETELTKIVTKDYTLMSEAEKRKESSTSSPFDALDDLKMD